MGYIFDPDRLHEAARKATGLSHAELWPAIRQDLEATYPGHLAPKEEWVFNLAAGATGIMALLHASLTEYLIIFGSPCGTEGYSSRYALEIRDWVINGEMVTYTEDKPGTAVVTRPGEGALLKRFMAKGYKITGNTWMLEYGRGFVPSALPTGMSDALISALDFPTIVKTVRLYGGLVVRELMKGKL